MFLTAEEIKLTEKRDHAETTYYQPDDVDVQQ